MNMPMPAASKSSSAEHSLAELIEELSARMEAGEPVELQAYLDAHPEHTGELRRLYPALQLLADFSRSGEANLPPEGLEPAPALGTPLGDFRLLREIGRGGMGVVYEAEQLSLGRRVALKVLPFASTLDAKQLQRFKNEAQAAAHLHHPNIVQVFATGCERGVHYYAMQLIDGHTLAAFIAELRSQPQRDNMPAEVLTTLYRGALPIPVEQPAAPELPAVESGTTAPAAAPPALPAATPQETIPVAVFPTESIPTQASFFRLIAWLGIQAAEALEHAHQLGIVHRDIKPANLLVDGRGNLWVTDFGLAHCQSQTGLTMSGDLVGTLRYMSPEQALGQRLLMDHRSDIYSLGVTLYELLTLEPPFAGNDRQELLRQIAFEEPRPPRRLNKAVPAELETIVFKAMAKLPAERYASVQELADDLRRFLEEKPIRARRATLVQRSRKWARRHPGVVATATAALVVLVLALAVSNVRITREKNQKEVALNEKDAALIEKDAALSTARRHELTARRRFYAAQMNLAQQAWEAGNPARVLDLLESLRPGPEEVDLRSFEWYYLWRACHQGNRLSLKAPHTRVACLTFSPDGKTLAAGYRDSTVRLWDAATGRQLAISNADGGEVASLAFAPDSRSLFIVIVHGSRNVKRWDLVTGREVGILGGRRETIWCAALSPDGTTLATGAENGTVTLLDAATLQEQATLSGHKMQVYCMAFSPDGRKLASASGWGEDNGSVMIWDLASRSAHRLPTVGCYGMAFSSDSQWLALSGNEAAPPRLFDVATGRQQLAFERHSGVVYAIGFAPDGKTVATGGNDRTVRFFDARTGEQRASYADAGPIYTVGFSPDGRILASAGYDGTIHLRDAMPVREDLILPGAGTMVAFSPDGKTFASTGPAALRLWDVATWKETAAFAFAGPSEPEESLAFAHDGKTLAVAHYRTLKLFDVAPLRERVSLVGARVFWCVAFSPDDKTLALASKWLPYVSLRDPITLQERVRLAPDPLAWARVCAFSPDGALAATGSQYGILKLFDVATGQVRATLQPGEQNGPDWLACAVFSLDGKLLASGDRQGTVKLWDVATGEPRMILKGHTDVVRALAFTGDGSTLATGADDKTVKLWDVATGQERITLKDFKAPVHSLAFAPDDSLLAAGSEDGTVRVWLSAADTEALARRAGDPAN